MVAFEYPSAVATALVFTTVVGTVHGRQFLAGRYRAMTKWLIQIAARAPWGTRFLCVTVAIVAMAPIVVWPFAVATLRQRTAALPWAKPSPVAEQVEAGGIRPAPRPPR